MKFTPFNRLLLLVLLLAGISTTASAQTLFQTVRGQVLDDVLEAPLADASVQVIIGEKPIGVYTGEDGRFELKQIPVGRVTVTVSYLGYETQTIPNVVVTSGKEIVLNIRLREDLKSGGNEVVVTADRVQGQALNEFSTLSIRPFSPEESARFAGSLGDPARMASNFAGVATAGDTRNDIVVRGNSPLGLLWRLEGVDIPNPNHFSTQGANGGPVSILNNNTLGSSDFATGAWAAEYGNATSGVFDLKLRTGNTAKRESSFQLGFNGLELFTEGPFKTGSNSSYLLAYRYSSLAVFDAIGLSFGDLIGIPYFQDLTFKTNFDLKKGGQLAIFGVGGQSNIDILESDLEDSEWADPDQIRSLEYQDIRSRVATATAGITHTLPLGDKGYLKSTLAYSYERRNIDIDTVFSDQSTADNYGERFRNQVWQLSLQYNRKISARSSLRIGFFGKNYQYDQRDSITTESLEVITLRDLEDNNTQLYQLYAQNLWRITPQLSASYGVHTMLFALNDETAIDPRASLKWQFTPKSSVSLGYGMHHQVQNFTLYYTQDADNPSLQPNKGLQMSRSQHVILGYEVKPVADWRIKLDTYYQWLDFIPVDPYASTFSAVNLGANFERIPDRTGFVSNGTAENVGLELTIEKQFTRHYYGLLTTSVYDSKYTASDGREYNTAYNNGYIINALGGFEYTIGKQGNNQFFGDFKLTSAGGFRYTPADIAASQAAGQEVVVPNSAFSEQAPAYFRLDVKLGIRQNFKRWSHEFSFQIQNITNNENLYSRQYNPRTGGLTDRTQLGFFPIPSYKVYF